MPKTRILFMLSLAVLMIAVASCANLEAPGDSRAAGPVAKAESLVAPPMVDGVPAPGAVPKPAEAGGAEAEPTRAKKIIRNAVMRFRVDDYGASRKAIDGLLVRFEGYLASEEEVRNSYSLENTMAIRVPSRHFDALLGGLNGLAAHVEQKSITAQDVTEQFVDLEARLRAKREVERGFVRLLEKAQSVEGMLAVQKELRVVREEIEAVEGRLRFLGDKVDYSTVRLTFYQQLEPTTDPERGFWYEVGLALDTGLDLLGGFFLGLLYVWPFLILIVLFLFGIRYLRRRKKRKA